jgi:hypothetical protein
VVAVAVDHDMQVVVVPVAWLFQPLLNLLSAIFHYRSVWKAPEVQEQLQAETVDKQHLVQ